LKNWHFTGFATGEEKGLWQSQARPDDNRLVFADHSGHREDAAGGGDHQRDGFATRPGADYHRLSDAPPGCRAAGRFRSGFILPTGRAMTGMMY